MHFWALNEKETDKMKGSSHENKREELASEV